EDQKKDSFINALINALQFFGGSPKVMIPDNLKAAVTKASKYEPEINSTFKEFAVHYGFAINPTRSYSPQDKALVEKSVDIVYQRIYYPIRNMLFTSLQDLNDEIRQRLGDYNDLLYKRKNASRKELFQAHELPVLKPLPASKYDIVDQRKAKVQKTGYVYFSVDKTYYSVPYQYIGKSTII
ncbi:IS21 family transposase, partial [Arthrospira platensis SPKY2]